MLALTVRFPTYNMLLKTRDLGPALLSRDLSARLVTTNFPADCLGKLEKIGAR